MITIPGRIPLHIFPLFWVLIFLIGWMNAGTLEGTAIWSLVILVSVVCHEYGHALTALAFGQKSEISLIGIGGQTTRQGRTLERWKEFLIVLNGPLVGLLLFFLLFHLQEKLALPMHSPINYAFEIGIEVNLFWTILNLIPVWPLDGGQLMKILLEGVFGIRGFKVALWVSLFLAIFLGIFFIFIQQMFIGAVFFMLAFESYRAWSEIRGLGPLDKNESWNKILSNATHLSKEGQLNEALTQFWFVRDQAKQGTLFLAATEGIAQIYIDQGRYREAFDLLLPMKPELSLDSLFIVQQLAYRLENWEEVVKTGNILYGREHLADSALLNAYASAIMGKAQAAIGWLHSAEQCGVKDIHAVANKREFDAIRGTPEWQAWLKN